MIDVKQFRHVFLQQWKRIHSAAKQIQPAIVVEWLLLATLFFLPIQTRYIFSEGSIYGLPSELKTISYYFTDVLVVTATLITLLWHQSVVQLSRKEWLQRVLVFVSAGLFFVIAFFSVLFSAAPSIALFWLWKLGIGMLFGALIVLSRLSWKKALWTWSLAMSIQGLWALVQWRMQYIPASTLFGIAEQNPDVPGVQVIDTPLYARVLRAYGALPHPNILGGFLVSGILAGIALFRRTLLSGSKRALYLRVVLLIMIGMQIAGLWTSASRSAFLALGLVLIGEALLHLLRGRPFSADDGRLVIAILTPLLLLTAAFPWFLAPRAQAIVAPTTALEQRSINERAHFLNDALTLIDAKWQTGTGIGNYTQFFIQPVHNILLYIFAEIGIFGILLFLLFLVLYLAAILEAIRPHSPTTRTPANWQLSAPQYFGVLIFSSFVLIGLFDHYFWSYHPGILLFWSMLGIGLLPAISKKKEVENQ